ncbi:hypothetical protein [Streptomyces shenzhenensis]|uniref:hypothetical protein n=1 Tax=Streptomyces shenzhenensis TaxID=943815 RepID=UPI0033EAD00B
MVDRSADAASPPTGYHLLLPEDWVRIPLRQDDAENTVRSLVNSAFERLPAGVPRDKLTLLRLELERRVLSAVAEARKGGALEMYLPVKLAGEVNLGASFTLSQVRLPVPSEAVHGGPQRAADPMGIVMQLLAGDRGAGDVAADLSSGEVDGAVAVRRERVVPADPERGVEAGTRRVEYLVAMPADPSQWLVVAFSTIGGGSPRDELADAMVEWFDALMTTFRWSWT